jgi:hypothetical protein
MERLRKSAMLLLMAGLPAAALPFWGTSHDICFTAGSVTYQLSSAAAAPDYRVRIDNKAPRPDLRVRLVDQAELADFALVDDAGATASKACATAGLLRTVKIVPVADASDVTITVSRDAPGEAQGADFALFVHSARITHQDAAALFALMRHVQASQKVAAVSSR